jgi:hypothetical protein
MKKNKNSTLLITFDYELFLGSRSGTVENCMIRPTNAILKILEKHNQKAIFFIDTTYLYRLSEIIGEYPEAKSDYLRVYQQLIAIAKKGHCLFHHLHPHWLDANYLPEINEWDLSDNKRFTFSSISEIEKEKIFNYSFNFLTQIYKEANINSHPNGFRAGGLFIEPFCEFIPYFKRFNIVYEFSVVPETFREDPPFAYDFRGLPKNRMYSFKNDLTREDKNGYFKEYPISLIQLRGFSKITNSFYYRLNMKKPSYKIFGDGKSVSSQINKGYSKRKLSDFTKMTLPASIEFLNPGNISCYIRFIRENNYFHLLSHPKLLTPISIQQFDTFLKTTAKISTINNPIF